MYCENCGTKLEDGVKFCEECGAAVETSEHKNVINVAVAPTISASVTNNEFVFTKKMLRSWTLRTTETKVTTANGILDINMNAEGYYGKNHPRCFSSPLSAIQSARIKTAFDKIELLSAVVCIIIGLTVNWGGILVAALCLIAGYGKEIEITSHDGSKFKIPFSGADAENAQRLVSICNKG